MKLKQAIAERNPTETILATDGDGEYEFFAPGHPFPSGWFRAGDIRSGKIIWHKIAEDENDEVADISHSNAMRKIG